MIHALIGFISRLEVLIERLAARETLKTQDKLKAAGALVLEANAHQAAAKKGRRVAQAMRDLAADPAE